jgi:hypothetical protein
VSGATAIGGFGAYFWLLDSRWPISTSAQATLIGASWLAMTTAFEFGFGRAVAHQSWEELLTDYDLKTPGHRPCVDCGWAGSGQWHSAQARLGHQRVGFR